MATVTVEGEKRIARPLEVVQAQFVDMHHHATTRVHADLEVSNVRPLPDGYRVTGRRKVLGLLQEDEIEVRRGPDGNSTLRSVSGSNAGLLITQTFAAEGMNATRVQTRVEMPVNGLLRLLAPLLRLGLKRDLETALEEDRRDLEERGYPRA
jgi:hypothetical protein